VTRELEADSYENIVSKICNQQWECDYTNIPLSMTKIVDSSDFKSYTNINNILRDYVKVTIVAKEYDKQDAVKCLRNFFFGEK
jgi:hypothetical protein